MWSFFGRTLSSWNRIGKRCCKNMIKSEFLWTWKDILPEWAIMFSSVGLCLLTWRVLNVVRLLDCRNVALLFFWWDIVVKVKFKHVPHLIFFVGPSVWDELCLTKRNILCNAFRVLDLLLSQQSPQTSRQKHECDHHGNRYYNVLACESFVQI